MKPKTLLHLSLAVVLVMILSGGMTMARWTQAQGPQDPLGPQAAVGTAFTYQGQLKKDGRPVNGNCDFEFRLYDSSRPTAKQIGPTILETVPVEDGLFDVELDFGDKAFTGFERWLDITVVCGLGHPASLGRQELTAVPYALYALDAPWDGLPYAGVVVLAKSGGDYASVQAAIDSIGSAAADNPYLVWIAPGVYDEAVTMAPYIHLQGAGQEATIISNDASVTLELATHASVRDLTVLNDGAYSSGYAIRAEPGVTETLVANVTARGQGSGNYVHGFRLRGSSTSVTLLDVTAVAEGIGNYNYGLYNSSGATAIIHGGSFTARQAGNTAYGIRNYDGSAELIATGATVLAENPGHQAMGLSNSEIAILHGGSFTARGGTGVFGIVNSDHLEAQSVTAAGLEATSNSYGLWHHGGTATLHGGSFTAQGGSGKARGVAVNDSGTELYAHGISALGEGSTENLGIDCGTDASVLVMNSVLEGSDRSANLGTGTLTIILSSLLDGDVNGSADCLAVTYNGAFYENTCP